MQAYFVRMAADRQVVGIYTAPSLAILRDLVDECTDPGGCEYLAAGAGGIYQSGRSRAQFPYRFGGHPEYEIHPDDDDAFAGSRLSGLWMAALRDAKRWKPLVP